MNVCFGALVTINKRNIVHFKISLFYAILNTYTSAFCLFAGALYDATGDYSYSFYMAGGTLFLAGFICFPLRRLNACLKKRQAKKLKMEQQSNEALLDNTLTNGPSGK